jgi:integrase
MAMDLERQGERQRLGLEPVPAAGGGGTLIELLRWWLQEYSARSPSHERNVCTVEKHFGSCELGQVRLVELTAGKLETFLQKRATELAPQTLNHLRRFVLTAYNCARRAGRWSGANPAAEVRRRRVPKRKPDFLRVEEVPGLLRALAPRWRPLFATAIYTGLRKGELFGLRKSDVDLESRLLYVERSYDNDTTKGGHADAIPIATELVPYLQMAMRSSPSELVFPGPDGSMRSPDIAVKDVLQRALGRAGIVTGYSLVCRKKGCVHREAAEQLEERRCPRDGMKLWPKPLVRPIRFHDLRHHADLALMPLLAASGRLDAGSSGLSAPAAVFAESA